MKNKFPFICACIIPFVFSGCQYAYLQMLKVNSIMPSSNIVLQDKEEKERIALSASGVYMDGKTISYNDGNQYDTAYPTSTDNVFIKKPDWQAGISLTFDAEKILSSMFSVNVSWQNGYLLNTEEIGLGIHKNTGNTGHRLMFTIGISNTKYSANILLTSLYSGSALTQFDTINQNDHIGTNLKQSLYYSFNVLKGWKAVQPGLAILESFGYCFQYSAQNNALNEYMLFAGVAPFVGITISPDISLVFAMDNVATVNFGNNSGINKYYATFRAQVVFNHVIQ